MRSPGLAYVWIAYPKGGRADINRDSLWPIVAEHTRHAPDHPDLAR